VIVDDHTVCARAFGFSCSRSLISRSSRGGRCNEPSTVRGSAGCGPARSMMPNTDGLSALRSSSDQSGDPGRDSHSHQGDDHCSRRSRPGRFPVVLKAPAWSGGRLGAGRGSRRERAGSPASAAKLYTNAPPPRSTRLISLAREVDAHRLARGRSNRRSPRTSRSGGDGQDARSNILSKLNSPIGPGRDLRAAATALPPTTPFK